MLKRIFFTKFSSKKVLYQKLYNVLGFFPDKISLYEIALTHHSYKHNHQRADKINNNERLEFLGDAVLGFIIAEKLYNLFPYNNEGFLTEMRSKVVSRQKLNYLGKKMGLQQLIQFDKVLANNQTFMDTICGNALEAIVGAIYVDKGFNFTRTFILNKIVGLHIDIKALVEDEISYKAKLVKWGQKERKKVEFVIKDMSILNKRKFFEIAIMIDGEEKIVSRNHSKKIAEEQASEKACALLFI
ncbi:MAG: ribonuclease III [Bacteroidota bacterium]